MGVSLLAAEAQAAGYSAKVMYFNLSLAGDMGLEPYQRIATTFPPNLLIGEWFFADDLFGADIPDADAYLSDIFIPMAGQDETLIDAMTEARRSRRPILSPASAASWRMRRASSASPRHFIRLAHAWRSRADSRR